MQCIGYRARVWDDSVLYFALLLCRQDTIAASQAVWNGFDTHGICLVHIQLSIVLGMVLWNKYIPGPNVHVTEAWAEVFIANREEAGLFILINSWTHKGLTPQSLREQIIQFGWKFWCSFCCMWCWLFEGTKLQFILCCFYHCWINLYLYWS